MSGRILPALSLSAVLLAAASAFAQTTPNQKSLPTELVDALNAFVYVISRVIWTTRVS